mgnify:CR=1 FL=1
MCIEEEPHAKIAKGAKGAKRVSFLGDLYMRFFEQRTHSAARRDKPLAFLASLTILA